MNLTDKIVVIHRPKQPHTAPVLAQWVAVPAALQRRDEGLPLLKASHATLKRNMGQGYPAAAEASFYIALVHAENPLLEAEKTEIFNQLQQVDKLASNNFKILFQACRQWKLGVMACCILTLSFSKKVLTDYTL